MSNALTRYTPAQEAPDMDLATLGSVLVKSKYFSDTTEAAQAIVKVLAGREMGIGPIASMTGIYIVKNRVTMGANLIAAQIKRHPIYDYQVISLTDKGCELAFFERRGNARVEIGRSSFSQADAIAAGLTNNDTYKKFPRNMYFSRALTNGARWYTPDVFGGAPVYTPDELGAMSNEEAQYIPQANPATGEVIEPAPLSKREKMLTRIVQLTEEAELLELEVVLNKPLEEMSDDELTQHGKALKEAIEMETAAQPRAA